MTHAFRVTYDPEARAAYLYLTGHMKSGEAKKTVSVTENIILDFDEAGHLIGVELLDPALLHPILAAQAVRPGTRPSD